MKNIDNDTVRSMSRKAIGGGLAIALAAVLGGCAGTSDCLKTERYQDASAFPKLKSPAGLDVPAPDPDMQIPSVSNGPVAAYSAPPQGTDADNAQSRCLTTPPPLSASS